MNQQPIKINYKELDLQLIFCNSILLLESLKILEDQEAKNVFAEDLLNMVILCQFKYVFLWHWMH